MNPKESLFVNVISRSRVEGITLEQYFKLLQHLPIAVYTCDADGFVRQFNEAAVKLWGRKPEIGIDRWCGAQRVRSMNGEHLPSDETPLAKSYQMFETVMGSECIIERPDTTHRMTSSYPQLFINGGKIEGALNIVLDITDETTVKHIAVESGSEEETYQRMIEEVTDYAILMLDTQGNIQNWNKGAEAIKGYRAEEAIGKNFSIFYTLEDKMSGLPGQLLSRAKEMGRATHEGWRLRKDGSKFWGSIVITALHDRENNVIGFSKVTRDLSERKAAEEALRENAAKLEEKNRDLEFMNQELASFAYVSSHDLQEPLRKIQTFSSRIMDADFESLSSRSKDFFNRMQNAAARMQNLIDDLLAYSRTNNRSVEFENTDLNKIVHTVIGELTEKIEEKKATIAVEPLPNLPVIRFQFAQLVTNILSNSLKFAKEGTPPEIRIAYKLVGGTDLPDRYLPGKTFHQFSFRDNGIGFDPEHRYKIFEVFQRLHGRMEYGGSGIGLAICKKIAENHKGFITAEGSTGNGATFYLHLPA